jgi:hypothetical protein
LTKKFAFQLDIIAGQNYITFLPAISTEGLSKDDLPVLIEKTYQAMNDFYMKINERLEW